MPPPRDELDRLYRSVKQRAAGGGLVTVALSDALSELYTAALDMLSAQARVDLRSRVAGKEYFAFQNAHGKISRAINAALYSPDPVEWRSLMETLHRGDVRRIDPATATRATYSLAISFFATIDLTRAGDQKTPGTFFEYLIGHLFALRLGVLPTKKLPVLNLDMETTLPTDFVFDTGAGGPKFHLPVKTSTRERVIQVWAHQRVLDGVYGTGRFLGTPVILAETKTEASTRQVVEICLPDQWRIYQMHIAQLKRVYYLDVPSAYARLAEGFPRVPVTSFGQFFGEVSDLLA